MVSRIKRPNAARRRAQPSVMSCGGCGAGAVISGRADEVTVAEDMSHTPPRCALPVCKARPPTAQNADIPRGDAPSRFNLTSLCGNFRPIEWGLELGNVK